VRRGCVYYPAGSVACFEIETAVEPANTFAIPYENLRRYAAAGSLEILQVLQGNIQSEMERAIKACRQIPQSRRDNLLAVMEGRFQTP
jgi:hypothetical protein